MSMPAARWVGLTLGLLLCCIYTMHSVAKGATGATFLASYGYPAGISPPVCSHPPALSRKSIEPFSGCSADATPGGKEFQRCMLRHTALVT